MWEFQPLVKTFSRLRQEESGTRICVFFDRRDKDVLVFGATRSTPTVSATIGESNFMDAKNTSELIRRSRNSNKYIL